MSLPEIINAALPFFIYEKYYQVTAHEQVSVKISTLAKYISKIGMGMEIKVFPKKKNAGP